MSCPGGRQPWPRRSNAPVSGGWSYASTRRVDSERGAPANQGETSSMRSKFIAAAISIAALALPATAMAGGTPGGGGGSGGLGQPQLGGSVRTDPPEGGLLRQRPAERDQHQRAGQRRRRCSVGRQVMRMRPAVGQQADRQRADRQQALGQLQQRQPGRAERGGQRGR